MHNAFAITSLFVLNGGPKIPVMVTEENAVRVADFLKLSLDMGGFPLIQPVYDKSVANVQAD